jgi:hypothetical protein
MTTRNRRVQTAYDCPRCGRIVATEARTQHFSDESAEPVMDRDVLDMVLDYGACEVAQNAKAAGDPTPAELSECPVFGEAA